MRFAFYSPDGSSSFYWARLADEGHEVLVYIKNVPNRLVGEGIVKRTNNLTEWKAWGLSPGKNQRCVFVFDESKAGDLADELRKRGALVVGGSKKMDRLESDRAFATKLAKSLGMEVPPFEEFDSIPSAMRRAKTIDGEWVFKTDSYLEGSATYLAESGEDMEKYLVGLHKRFGQGGKCLLAKKIPGVAVSTACWWNGHKFLYPSFTDIEHKRFMNDDVGPNTGCSFNALCLNDSNAKIMRELHWDAFEAYMSASKMAPGIYDINSLVANKTGPDYQAGHAYYLEFTPRFGYDSEPTTQRMLTISLGEFLYKLAIGELDEAPFEKNVVAMGYRVTVPPYPWEWVEDKTGKKTCVGMPILGADGLWDKHFVCGGVMQTKTDLEIATPSGIFGVVVDVAKDVATADKGCLKYLKDELKVANRQYRTDGTVRVQEDAKALAKYGYKSLLGA